nr:VOC family protein [uncultured Desulfobacter sp.]
MGFTIDHFNINVLNLEKSMAFYEKALGLRELRRKTATDGSYIIVYLTDNQSANKLELTWLKDRKAPYDLGDEEFHIAFKTDDFDAAHALHEKMGCICYENNEMGIYFINDPDGYWLEVVPVTR